MSIEINWFATLVKRTRSKKPVTTAEWSPGLTPLEVFKAEGFSEADAEAVMTSINGEQCDITTELKDGDRLEFLVSIQGGGLDPSAPHRPAIVDSATPLCHDTRHLPALGQQS